MKDKKIFIGPDQYNVLTDDGYLDAMGHNFEPHIVEIFSYLTSQDSVAFDIGANIGLASLCLSNFCRKVFAFEPCPSTYELLRNNIKKSPHSNIDAINIGFGASQKSSNITYASNNRSGGFVSDKINLNKGHVTELIHIDTVDNYILQNSILPDFIKIDVEGYELDVILGAKKFLETHKPIVVIEMNAFCLNVFQRICLPKFIDDLRAVFPILYAIDVNNSNIADLHDENQTYMVMHKHMVNNRFPNIVGAYSSQVVTKLREMASRTTDCHRGWLRNRCLPLKLVSWSHDENDHRWSMGNLSSINFYLNDVDMECNALFIEGKTYGIQRLLLTLNGIKIYEIELSDVKEVLKVDLPQNLLRSGENVLNLELPDARIPGNGDTRMLGLALVSFKIV